MNIIYVKWMDMIMDYNIYKNWSVHRKPVGFSLKIQILRNFVTKNCKKKLESRRRFMVKKHHENLDICGLQNFEKFLGREKRENYSSSNQLVRPHQHHFPPSPNYDFPSSLPSTSHRSVSRRGLG
jgi:hypothetical protein